MGIRGRESSASLSVISSGGIETTVRPKPPSRLNSEQAAEWLIVVNGLSADWFRSEYLSQLEAYCRHAVASRKVAQLLADVESAATIDIEKYDRLLKMHERETRALSSLATRLRITPQSTYDPKRKKSLQAKKPWGEED